MRGRERSRQSTAVRQSARAGLRLSRLGTESAFACHTRRDERLRRVRDGSIAPPRALSHASAARLVHPGRDGELSRRERPHADRVSSRCLSAARSPIRTKSSSSSRWHDATLMSSWRRPKRRLLQKHLRGTHFAIALSRLVTR
eukprot:436739-Pleurochrysis_carterae.AAC.1